MRVSVHKNDICRAGGKGEGVQGGTSGQICSAIIPDSSDTLGFVRQSQRGVVEAIRSANLTSFAAAARRAGA